MADQNNSKTNNSEWTNYLRSKDINPDSEYGHNLYQEYVKWAKSPVTRRQHQSGNIDAFFNEFFDETGVVGNWSTPQKDGMYSQEVANAIHQGVQQQRSNQQSNKGYTAVFRDDWNSLFGNTRTNGVKRAWQRRPDIMQGFQDGQNAATILTLPFFAPAASALYSVPEIAGAINLYGATQGLGRLTSDEGIAKTYNKFKEGDYTGAAKSAFGDVVDIAMSLPVLSRLNSTANSWSNAFWNGFQNGAMRQRMSYPTNLLTESTTPTLATAAPAAVGTTEAKQLTGIIPRGFLGVPSSGRVQYGSVVHMPSSGQIIALDTPTANAAFIDKFNKWNQRYGYPWLPKSLAQDGNALNDAIKERLLQHNTFLRGVSIDRKAPGYPHLTNMLRSQGIEPTDDNVLEFLATHYLPESGRGGRAGFWNIPSVRQASRAGEDVEQTIGSIYTSNGLGTAVGYAHRVSGSPGAVFLVRRPLSFEGTREDWVRNAEFPLFNGTKKSTQSDLYYRYKLPYLMGTGRAVPSSINVNWDAVNTHMRELSRTTQSDLDDFKNISDVYKAHGRTPRIYGFGTGTPYLNYRISDLSKLLRKIADPQKSDEFFNGYGSLVDPDHYAEIRDRFVYTPEVLDKFETIVNSRNYRNAQYRRYKALRDENLKASIRHNSTFGNQTEQELEETLKQAGITPSQPIFNIGTSENLRTSTRLKNPEQAYQHFIFTGEPWTKGLEIVRKIPQSEYEGLWGTRHHYGTWFPEASRKSKKNGGKLTYEQD